MQLAGMPLAMVAGEASGDLLAGLLLGGLRERWPGLQTVGIGGPKMAEQGFQAWWPHEKLAVRGYVEVLSHYRELAGIRNQLDHHFLDEVAGLGAPTLENLCVFIFAQVHQQIPQVSAVAVSRAAGDRCVYRPRA